MPDGTCPKCEGKCYDLTTYTEGELLMMEFFARGYLAVPPLRKWLDTWETLSECTSIDLHFLTNNDEEHDEFGEIQVWGYRRNKVVPGDCVDEVRLI